ncbi:ATP synthase subunit I [Desulfogranum japonicum]|uniref:ATP synthase subunit I n=1 Tax=Desulfogranum japonicum TaxID=231447 RepID=UPI00040DB74A|nr:ATP synthase subunit I [Desulfogranum japonicum]
MKEDQTLIQAVILTSWLIVIVFILAGWYVQGEQFALSTLIGGILVNGSFLLLKKDIEQLLNKVSMAGISPDSVSRAEKIRFFIKFHARLVVFGLLLIALVAKCPVNLVGLALGMATVVLSVVVVVLSKGKKLYSKLRLRSV